MFVLASLQEYQDKLDKTWKLRLEWEISEMLQI